MQLVKHVLLAFTNKEFNQFIFIDFSKALYALIHAQLLSTLWRYCVRGWFYDFIESYLDPRHQSVKICSALQFCRTVVKSRFVLFCSSVVKSAVLFCSLVVRQYLFCSAVLSLRQVLLFFLPSSVWRSSGFILGPFTLRCICQCY